MNMNSGVVISRADGRPMYLQILEQIKGRIALGDWPPGSELPSIRQLAAEIGVSVITIQRAYLELERAGVIETRQGRGSFVATVPELGPRLGDEELARHLDAAARLALRLRIDEEQLADRLREAARRLAREKT
jgi:GntR family transcriptional regulator